LARIKEIELREKEINDL